jgi:threonine aldolase
MHEHPSDRVDMRSDTITQPTSAMRERMATAEVGDDVLGDDPTVIELQNRIAEIFGKEASLFVPSGTMSNAIAIRAHTNPGDEIVTEATSHIYIYEGGGYAALSGCSIALVPGHTGLMEPADVQKAIRKVDGSLGHFPNGSLVCVENSSNRGGGSCYSQEVLDDIAHIAHTNDCAAHMDGARIFNAAIATQTDVARMVRDYDSISICLSKGLGAPVGSMLIGDSEFIALAYRWRKMFGGGMRQAGILAAAGLFALDHNVERLAEDHLRAKRLATAVNDMSGFSIDLDSVQSNMVYISTAEGEAQAVVDRLVDQGVDTLTIDESTVRAVIHLHITDQDIERAITAFESVL